MKVLFAVSNEEISESIVKKYQKEYKQIISYKNVYYFNAISKELQQDKNYDRIVISEDLEAFTNKQYDQIDKFIYEKLDRISDEASDSKGNDIPIILICTDRRTKSEEILVKLFGIGIYNALIGNDRSVDEVCRIINRPRTKKEAKSYYNIDGNPGYQPPVGENDVSEMEIQNIITHYKRLGKDENRYVDSFNNIAAQYNDTQLRIISKFLPLNVRAVLEEKSKKYQQVMSFNNSISNSLRSKNSMSFDSDGPSEKLLKSKTREQILSKPVVIPSTVNMAGNIKLAKTKTQDMYESNNLDKKEDDFVLPSIDDEKEKDFVLPTIDDEDDFSLPMIDDDNRDDDFVLPSIEDDFDDVELNNNEKDENIIVQPKRGRGRPRKNVANEIAEPVVKKRRGRPRKNVVEEETFLPGFANVDDDEDDNLNFSQSLGQMQEVTLPSLDSDVDDTDVELDKVLFEEDSDEPEISLPMFEEKSENILEEEKDTEISNYDYETQEDNYTSQNRNYNFQNNNNYGNDRIVNNSVVSRNNFEEDEEQNIDLSHLLENGKKIVTFVGTSKNGTSFIVNNIAELMSLSGVNVAILDMTQNRNAYYIYTKNEEQLRNVASRSIAGLGKGVAQGIKVNKNLTVYTTLPNEEDEYVSTDKVLETLLKEHSLVLIDADFSTPLRYFKQTQELYLVQTFDILTIQALTAFLRELKAKDVLNERKIRIVLNKTVKIKGINEKTIIGGMAYYNDPSMSYMTELFDRNLVKYVTIPFEEETYIRYLEGIINCEISIKGYSKAFMYSLGKLGNMIFPMVSNSDSKRNGYQPPSIAKSRRQYI